MSVLSVKNLRVSYKNGKLGKSVLQGVEFDLNQGDFVCLCGPNGCGKSTLLSVIAGVPDNNLVINEGTVLFGNEKTKQNDINLSSLHFSDRAKILAYMQQTEASAWDFTVEEYVLQGRFAHSKGGHYSVNDRTVVMEVLVDLGLDKFADRTVHTLSGGEFQKVRIARAFAQQPSFMLLDEPAASLDFVYEPQLMTLLKNLAEKKNIGILVTIHDINIAYNYAKKIMLLPPEKNVLIGTPGDIMSVENLKTTFGVDFQCKETKSFQLLQ